MIFFYTGYTIQGSQLQFCLKIFESMKEMDKVSVYFTEYN